MSWANLRRIIMLVRFLDSIFRMAKKRLKNVARENECKKISEANISASSLSVCSTFIRNQQAFDVFCCFSALSLPYGQPPFGANFAVKTPTYMYMFKFDAERKVCSHRLNP